MQWRSDKFSVVEEKDFVSVAAACKTDYQYIARAVSVWHEDLLCGYLLTCNHNGIKTFHGFKFVHGGLEFQIPITRRYIEDEKLNLSVYRTKETRYILRVLGFKEIGSLDGVYIARKE